MKLTMQGILEATFTRAYTDRDGNSKTYYSCEILNEDGNQYTRHINLNVKDVSTYNKLNTMKGDEVLLYLDYSTYQNNIRLTVVDVENV